MLSKVFWGHFQDKNVCCFFYVIISMHFKKSDEIHSGASTLWKGCLPSVCFSEIWKIFCVDAISHILVFCVCSVYVCTCVWAFVGCEQTLCRGQRLTLSELFFFFFLRQGISLELNSLPLPPVLQVSIVSKLWDPPASVSNRILAHLASISYVCLPSEPSPKPHSQIMFENWHLPLMT